jgi:gliding motility-associated-like protein
VAVNVAVGEPAQLTASAVVTNITCFGAGDGTVSVIANGGTAPYTYDDGSGPQQANTFPNLSAGIYTITVVDANGCSTSATGNIVEPAPVTVTAVATSNFNGFQVSCANSADGIAAAVVLGGSQPFVFTWSNGGTSDNLSGLPAGQYVVTVTDVNGCTAVDSLDLNAPDPLTATATAIASPNCFGGSDGSAVVVALGGVQPFVYLWDNGETTVTASNLTFGIHFVTVTDANGCSIETFTVVPVVTLVTVDLEGAGLSCFGSNDGTISAIANGGTFPYTYTWNPANINASNINNLAAGSYSVIVADVNGCTATDNITIGEPQPLVTDVVVTDANCWNSLDGTATAVPSGGTPFVNGNYAYEWSNTQNVQTAENLDEGTYFVTVTDANGCSALDTAVVDAPDELEIEVATTGAGCTGSTDGTITIVGFGGTAPYATSIDGVTFDPGVFTYTGQAAGVYEVYLQDSLGCETSTTAVVTAFSPIDVEISPVGVIQMGTEVQLDAQLLTPVLNPVFNWSPGTALSCTDCQSPVAAPVETTLYTLTVTDANGCSDSASVLVRIDKQRNVFIPTAFTPNGDGLNDAFHVYGGDGVARVPKMMVFDRWGELVFEATDVVPNDPTLGWSGLFKGKMMNPAVFIYYIEVEFVDGTILDYKGEITLIR